LKMPGGKDGANAGVVAESEALLAERAAIVKGRDQKKVDAWRLAVGRAVDRLMAE